MNVKSLYSLMGMVTVAWLLVVAESFVFIAVIRPLGPTLHGGGIPSSVLKVILTLGLAVLWVAVMFTMDALYSRSKRKTPSATS